MVRRRIVFVALLLATAAGGAAGLLAAILGTDGYPPAFIVPIILLGWVGVALVVYVRARWARPRGTSGRRKRK